MTPTRSALPALALLAASGRWPTRCGDIDGRARGNRAVVATQAGVSVSDSLAIQ